MRPILAVTLNPALDIATSVNHVTAGVKLRCGAPQMDPGGGGLNVARAIHLLGGQATAFVALGGHTGQKLRELTEVAGLTLVVHPAPGETRQSLAVTDEGLGDQYRFMLPGPEWGAADLAKASEAIKAASPADAIVVLSGSGPLGASPDLYLDLCAALDGNGRDVIVDTSGAALHRLAEGQHKIKPWILRMDQGEAEGLAGHALRSNEETAAFARYLLVRGVAETVIIARGAHGSVLVNADESLAVKAAAVPVRSRVGAGDSFVGGFVKALAEGKPLREALSWGSATASAAVMTEGTELCRPEDAERLVADSPVTPIQVG